MSIENDPFPNKAHKASQFTNADMSGSNFNGVLVTEVLESYSSING